MTFISQNSSPHARHVSLDGMSVHHPIKVLEPDQNPEGSRISSEPHSQMLEFPGLCVNV